MDGDAVGGRRERQARPGAASQVTLDLSRVTTAALEAELAEREELGSVLVACGGPGCHTGGEFVPEDRPYDDDGHPFTYAEGEWWCASCYPDALPE